MAEQIVMPKLAMSMKEGIVLEWQAKEGERVEKDQIILVIETEKVTYEVEAPADGYLHILVAVDETVPVMTPLALLAETEADLAELQAGASTPPSPVVEKEVAELSPPPAEQKKKGKVKISPLAKKLAGQNNLDITLITGTGPGGRIKKSDVMAFMETETQAPVPVKEAPTGEIIDGKRVRDILPLRGVRRAMAHHMHLTHTTAARVSSVSDIDMTEMIRLRNDLNQREKDNGIRFTFTDLFVFITARVLNKFPIVNATFGDGQIIVWEDVNVGVALSLAEGVYGTNLIVPVIKQADKKPLADISRELRSLIEKGKNGKLTHVDMSGGTFTITNTGMLFDRWHAQTPMITQPESAVWGPGTIADKPVVVDGQIVVRPMMPVSFSFDHRVMDGSQPAGFVMQVTHLMEKPDLIWTYV